MNMEMIRWAALALFLALLSRRSAVAQNPVSTSIDMSIVDNDIFVNAYINGKGPFNFLVDTGASGVGRVDSRIVKQLALPVVDSTKNYDGSGKYAVVPVIKVSSLHVGNIQLKDVELLSRNYNVNPKKDQVLTDGIIGRDFFENSLVVVDVPNRKLFCTTDSLTLEMPGVVAYTKPFQIEGQIGSKSITFNIDTGSNLSLHFPKALLDQLQHADTGRQSVARRANSEYLMKETVLKEPIILSLVAANDQIIYYSESATHVNVGMSFLKNYKMTIDPKRKLFKIE